MVLCGLLGVGAYLANSLPDNYKVTQNSGIQTHNMIPVTAKTENNQTLVEAGILNHPDETYQADLMLLDAIPIKTVDVEVVEETQVIPCGTPFGVKIFTQGVVVVGMSDLKSNGKTVNPARSAGLKIGDVITSINGIQVNTNEEVAAIIEKSAGASYFVLRPYNVKELASRILHLKGSCQPSAGGKPVASHSIQGQSIEIQVTDILHQIGVPAHIKGYHYLRDSILMSIENPEIINAVTKQLYPAVAKKYETTSSRVERAIRHAIEVAWDRGDVDILNSLFGYYHPHQPRKAHQQRIHRHDFR